MKKLLLCTTALVGFVAGSAFADESAANTMQVTVGGNSKFEAGSVSRTKSQRTAYSFSPNQESSTFYTSQKAYLKAEGKSDDLVYGAVVRLQTVANSANGLGDTRNDRSHIFLDTNAGSVQLGTNFAASKLMQVDAGTIASGSGGASDGDWPTFVDGAWERTANSAYDNDAVFTNADQLSDKLDGRVEGARKITYISPTISGVRLGVSFTPDLQNNGGEGALDDNKATYLGSQLRVKNIWSLALSYNNSFNDVDVALSATGNSGTFNKRSVSNPDGIQAVNLVGPKGNTISTYVAPNGAMATSQQIANLQSGNLQNRNNLKTYALGGVVGYNGFKVALSYGSDGKSLSPTNVPANQPNLGGSNYKSTWWTSGVAYESGPGSVSLTYMNGTKGNKNSGSDNNYPQVKTTVWSLGAAYEVAPGLKPFAEIDQVTLKPKKVTNGNTKYKATVYLLGTRIKF